MANANKTVDPNVPAKHAAHTQTIDQVSEGYHDVSTGFHPYFSPSPGAWFKGTLIDVDATNVEFIRFTFVSETDLECFTGPVDDQESVMVKAGMPFNVSSYSQVKFEDFGGMSIIVQFVEKVKTATAGRSVWKMKLKLSEQDYKLLMAQRVANMQSRVTEAKRLRAEAEKSGPKQISS